MLTVKEETPPIQIPIPIKEQHKTHEITVLVVEKEECTSVVAVDLEEDDEVHQQTSTPPDDLLLAPSAPLLFDSPPISASCRAIHELNQINRKLQEYEQDRLAKRESFLQKLQLEDDSLLTQIETVVNNANVNLVGPDTEVAVSAEAGIDLETVRIS